MNRIISFIYFVISIFLFFYILYKSEIVFQGSNREYYLNYFILSFVFLFISILNFKLSKKLNILVNISIFFIVVSFYMFEYYLKINSNQNSVLDNRRQDYKLLYGKKWDERSQYQVYRDLLHDNPNVVPSYYPSELNLKSNKIFSLAGVSNSLTIFCNENGYFSISKSDRYGFNNPDEEWDADEIDYVFVGDSFTHGHCVNRPHDIPSVIRGIETNKVLNLGYGRNGPLTEYAVLREYLPKSTKKIIFMYYGGNDLQNLNEELANNILLKYLNNENFSQNLKTIQSDIDHEKRKNIIARSKGDKFKFIKLRQTRAVIEQIISFKKNINQNDKITYNFKKLEQILFLTKKLSIKNNSKLFFVYLHADRYFNINQSPSEDALYFQKVKSIVKKLNINFIDVHQELFEQYSDPKSLFPFGEFGHYSEKGYKKVADIIYSLTKD